MIDHLSKLRSRNYLTCDGIKFCVVSRDDRQNSWQFVINKVIVILAVVERVEDQSVKECSLVLGLTYNKWNFGESALDKQVLGSVGKDLSINIGSEPPWE